jgi:hypothetical protein
VAFFRAAGRLQAEDQGLKQVLLSADRGRERLAAMRDTIRPVAIRIVQRAKDAGALREDLSPFDVPMLHAAASAIADITRDIEPAYYQRLLTIMLDGLARRDGMTAMTAPPLDVEQFTTAMSRRR